MKTLKNLFTRKAEPVTVTQESWLVTVYRWGILHTDHYAYSRDEADSIVSGYRFLSGSYSFIVSHVVKSITSEELS